MKDLTQFEESDSAESDKKSDITVLEGKGTKEEIKLRDRAQEAERMIQ